MKWVRWNINLSDEILICQMRDEISQMKFKLVRWNFCQMRDEIFTGQMKFLLTEHFFVNGRLFCQMKFFVRWTLNEQIKCHGRRLTATPSRGEVPSSSRAGDVLELVRSYSRVGVLISLVDHSSSLWRTITIRIRKESEDLIVVLIAERIVVGSRRKLRVLVHPVRVESVADVSVGGLLDG